MSISICMPYIYICWLSDMFQQIPGCGVRRLGRLPSLGMQRGLCLQPRRSAEVRSAGRRAKRGRSEGIVLYLDYFKLYQLRLSFIPEIYYMVPNFKMITVIK